MLHVAGPSIYCLANMPISGVKDTHACLNIRIDYSALPERASVIASQDTRWIKPATATLEVSTGTTAGSRGLGAPATSCGPRAPAHAPAFLTMAHSTRCS